MFRTALALVAWTVLLALPPSLVAQASVAPTAPHPAQNDCATLSAAGADHANMDHSAHGAIMASCATALPIQPGQAALGAIAEIVRLLRDDPRTDWSKVNIAALRQHLIDMDEVAMRARIVQHNIPGGISAEITGSGSTVAAIQRIAVGHSAMLAGDPKYRASAVALPKGVRVTITANDSADSTLVAQIRGLGFAGLLTEGDHHARHHLALARGDDHPHEH